MSTPTLRGPWIVAAGVVLVGALVGAGLWYLSSARPEVGEIERVHAIDAEHAMLLRAVKGDDARQFLVLYQHGHGAVWRALVPRAAELADGLDPIIATSGVVTLRMVTGDGEGSIIAFDAGAGRKLGRRVHVTGRGDSVVLDDVAGLADDLRSFDVWGSDGAWALVAATDLTDGGTLWRQELDGARIRGAWIAGGDVILYDRGELVVLDGEDGAERARWRAGGHPCVSGDVAVASVDGAVAVFPLAGGEARISPLQVASPLPGACGRRGDHLVVATPTGLAALDPATAGVVWSIELGVSPDTEALRGPLRRAPDRAPLGGALPRVVPVQLAPAPGERARELAIVDVEHGRVVARGDAGGVVFRGADRYFWHDAEAGILASLSPESGAITGAARAEGFTPAQLGDGGVWLVRGESLEVLDPVTLGGDGEVATEARQGLGLRP